MKAIVVSEFGGPEQLVLGEVSEPRPGPGQVRIAVAVAATNPVDAGLRTDGRWAGVTVPFVPGYDVAGVVDAVGADVREPAVGDRVMAMTPFPRGGGGYAESVVVEASAVAVIAPEVGFQDAAATPLAGGTALEVLDRLSCAPGSRLLVLGASGGVGLFLLQLARARGISTIAVGRSARHPQMSELGAAACVDYTREDIAERALALADGPVDAIADLVGGPTLNRALPALRPGGAIAAIQTPELDLDLLLDNNWTLHGVLVHDDGPRLRRLAALLADGSLRAVVSHLFPLADAARAHELLQRGGSGGKILLETGR
ncbi:NADP-dependent oxidoreductase [Streptacidiphilus sp. P02-A3a]|uniref:quinone oxidoreductase family protein n=1 Tax=Streptacidiphilus sp. P02-A3a TaxID=2704468 RepID=UPI0015FD57DB|nr:NADP-dependent oxidoreductase [Streptacidiphilus sp. P02-A3a]QMU73104.1 NADP-dependent oxidoreductase [Streptacidiphilus sp. P02-A3a]